MVDEREAQGSCVLEESSMSAYPMYFGVSCALVALQLLSSEEKSKADNDQWALIIESMLQGSAHLLGLLVWKAQGGEAIEGRSELLRKLRRAECEVDELKRRRSEDAKANEKVMSIFASQEQSWISERKRLRQHIQALLNHLQVLEAKKEQTISILNKRIEEKESVIESTYKALEEEEKKGKDLEEKLREAEANAGELRETAKKEAQEHSLELWKHKTAFIELVSNQRQLEAEMGRALRQVEAMRQELDAVYEQKEESELAVQRLSTEIVKMEKDGEQKDEILSAMLRKSKSDTMEKQILLKEVKTAKARRKQAELETERWRTRCEVRHDKTWRSNSIQRADSWSDTRATQSIEAECSHHQWPELQPTSNSLIPGMLLHGYLESERRKELEWISQKRVNDDAIRCSSQCSPEEIGELVITTNARQLEDWVRTETEKYISILEQRHYAEIDAFSDQMRLKDEKLEAFRWRLLSMELESKRLQSHIDGLDENLSHFREESMKLEALLIDKDNELKSLKEKFDMQTVHFQRKNVNYGLNPPAEVTDDVWSEVTIVKRKGLEKQKEPKAISVGLSTEVENEIRTAENMTSFSMPIPEETQEKVTSDKENSDISDVIVTELVNSESQSDIMEETVVKTCKKSLEDLERSENDSEDLLQDRSLATETPKEEIEEERELGVDPGHVQEVDKSASSRIHLVKKDSPWKTDLHALGVAYKIKRLKQQLHILEKLALRRAVAKPTSIDSTTNMPETCEKSDIEDEKQIKGVIQGMSLLNRQVKRYQSLQEKTDDLCQRMHDSDLDRSIKKSSAGKTKAQTGTLEHFLEETFQLQRYMVATGQKLMEIQSRIASVFEGLSEHEEPVSSDLTQFGDSIRTLFKETQRGLEVRISRIIGDLEGTLACDGILNLRK